MNWWSMRNLKEKKSVLFVYNLILIKIYVVGKRVKIYFGENENQTILSCMCSVALNEMGILMVCII